MTDESMRAGRFWKRRGVSRRRNDVVMSGMAAGGESFCVRRLFSEACSLICLFAVVCFALFYSREAGEFALSGMRLAVLAVIPSSFVSMLVCDLYRRVGYPERITFFGRLFSLLFGISRAGLQAFLLGNLCGFPMGAREAGEAYSEGLISREEAERLLPICTNPSPAFTVGVVGGMLGDFRVGVRLFFCVLSSAVICGAVFRKRGQSLSVPSVIVRQKYNLVQSVRGAGGACITLVSFISGFSVVLGFLKKYVGFLPLRYALFALLEVAGGVNFFINEAQLSPAASGALTALSLGFGGLSVMLQSAAFASDYGLRLRGYLPVKLLQGALSAALFLLIEIGV